MITFWNRKEVYIGYSMAEFTDIRDTLTMNQMKCTYRIVHSKSRYRRGVRGSFGERAELSCMYYIYVHKDDYEWAYRLIRERKEEGNL